MKRKSTILSFILIVLTWFAPDLAAESIDFSDFPGDTHSLVFIDCAAARDLELVNQFRDQVVKTIGWEKDLDRFLFLSGIDLSQETPQLALTKVPSDSEKMYSVGLMTGNFSDKTKRAIGLSQELMRERNYRVVEVDESQVVFGAAEAVALYLEAADKLAPETVRTLQSLKSQGPLFGWMRKGWLGEHIPKDFNLGQNPEWSLIWARDQIEQQSFTVSVSSPLQFNLDVVISDPKGALVLHDELQNHLLRLIHWERKGEFKTALESANLRRNGGHLSMTLELTEDALEKFGEENGLEGTLNWGMRPGRREGWQRVADILEAAEIKAGDRVADVGAGSGFLSTRLARIVGAEGQVWAVDIDSETLERVRKRAEIAPYPQIRVVVGETDDPKLPKEPLDAVFVINAYHEMEQHEAMLDHFRKALKPKGRLVVVEPWEEESNDEPRTEQIEDHVIAPDLVEAELKQAGFEIRSRKNEFTETWQQSLIVAIRP